MSQVTTGSDFPLDTLFKANTNETDEVAPTIGRFSILHKLGQGGMGVVYLGYDARLDRRAAVKLLRSGGSGEIGRARLLREAQALARLSHPNVVPIYESGEHGDDAYIAMEYVAGHTLRDWIKTAPRTTAQILEVFVAAGRGLEAAHAHGLAHRDFKPENVMVGEDGRARVMDFGLVRVFDDAGSERLGAAPIGQPADVDLTATGALLGTPAYMAPEQYRGDRTGPQTDQFSFCVALWEALYGERPFTGQTIAQLSANILDGRITAPAADAKVPTRIRKALERGMATEPEDRWPSMGALLALLGSELLLPRRRALAAAAVVIIALLISAAGFAWQKTAALSEAMSEERRAAFAEQRALKSSELLAQGHGVEALAMAIEAAASLADEWGSIPARLPREVGNSLHAASTAELSWGVVATFPTVVTFATTAIFSPDGTHLALAQTGDYGNHYINIHSIEGHTVSAELTGHRCHVSDMQFFANGSRLLTHCFEGENLGLGREYPMGAAHLWDTSGELLTTFEPRALSTVSPEGLVVATRSQHDVKLTGTSGDTVATLRGHADEPIALVFSIDGSRLATVDTKGVRVWAAPSGAALATIDHAGVVAAAWFADGSGRLATVAIDQHVRIWAADSGELLASLAPGADPYSTFATEDVHGLATSSDGSRVALYIDRKMWLWDTLTGKLIEHFVDHSINPADNGAQWVQEAAIDDPLRFSPDGSRMVLRRHDGGIVLFDAGSGAPIKATGVTLSYSFSPDGEFLAVAEKPFESDPGDDHVDIWDSDTGVRLRSLDGWFSNIMVFSPNGRLLATRQEKGVDVWDTQAIPSSVAKLNKSSSSAIVLAVAPDGGRFLMADADLATVWDAGSGQQLTTLEGHAEGIRLAEFSRDGRVLGSIDRDEVLRVWDPGSSKLIGGPLEQQGPVTALAVSDDGTHVALASNGIVRIRDVRTTSLIVELDGHEHGVLDIAFSPDGRLLATLENSPDRRLRSWSLPSGELFHEISFGGSSITFSPDGTRLGTTQGLGDVSTRALVRTLEESLGFGPAVFSPTGSVLAVGGQLFDGSTGAFLHALKGHELPVQALGFLEGGERIVTASRDAVIVRDAAPPMAVACMRLRPYIAYADVAEACDPTLRAWEAERARIPEVFGRTNVDEKWIEQSVWSLAGLMLMLVTGLPGRIERLCAKLPYARMVAVPAYHLCFSSVITIIVAAAVAGQLIFPDRWWVISHWPTLSVLLLPPLLGVGLRKSPNRWWVWVSLATITGAAVCAVVAPELIANLHAVAPTGSTTLMALGQPFEHAYEHSSYSGFAAHVTGHRALHHRWQSLAVFAIVVSLGLFGVHRLGSFVATRYGSRLGFTSLAERGAMPLVLLLLVAFGLVSAPVLNALARHQERQADRFALDQGSDERSCAANAVMQQTTAGLNQVHPDLANIIWYGRQPPLAARIEACSEAPP